MCQPGRARRAPGIVLHRKGYPWSSHRLFRPALCTFAAAVLVVAVAEPDGGATRTSPSAARGPFSQNEQNEPALAVDAAHPNVLVAGANDNIDMEPCNAEADNNCPFTPGVGVSGVYFSMNPGRHLDPAHLPGPTARDSSAWWAPRCGLQPPRARSARCPTTTRPAGVRWGPGVGLRPGPTPADGSPGRTGRACTTPT